MDSKNKLKDKNIINTCARMGKKVYSRFFILKFLPSKETRFAIVVSKKVSTKATVRNYKKRQIRVVLQENILSIPKIDGLLVLKNEAVETKFSEIKIDLEDLLKRVK